MRKKVLLMKARTKLKNSIKTHQKSTRPIVITDRFIKDSHTTLQQVLRLENHRLQSLGRSNGNRYDRCSTRHIQRGWTKSYR